ncbi:2054_t:CDS:2, partial [Dentiscutata heterogama]
WIPFEDISDVEYLAKGSYGCIYKAKWKCGPIRYYDDEIQVWHRIGETDIVLKSIKILNDMNEFIEEIKTQTQLNLFVVGCFGITKCPNSDINENITPKTIVDLIKRCWSEEPGDRPTAIELLDELSSCRRNDHKIWNEIEPIEKNMNFDIPPEKASLDYKPPEKAIYTSQLITISQEL